MAALLSSLLKETKIRTYRDCLIEQISNDSRNIKPGALFFALKGSRANGLDFIRQAISKGAVAVIYEDILPENIKDGYPDGRGVGFYFRNVTEILLFGVKGDSYRTLPPARSQVNLVRSMKREHSRKPDEIYPIIEACSAGPFLEMFARGVREKWVSWGNQADSSYEPTWHTYANHTHSGEGIHGESPESDLFAFG